MKKCLVIILCLLPSFMQAKVRFKLQCSIEGISDQMIYLFLPESKSTDSTMSMAGKFTFKGFCKEPMMAKIQAKGSSKYIQVFLENGKISLKAEFNKADGRYKNIQITGSREHDVYLALTGAERGGFTPDELSRWKEYKGTNDTTSLNKLKAAKTLEMEEAHIVIRNIVREHPQYYAVAYFISSARIDPSEKRIRERFYELYSLIDERIKNSYYGRKFITAYNKK